MLYVTYIRYVLRIAFRVSSATAELLVENTDNTGTEIGILDDVIASKPTIKKINRN